MPLFVLLVLVIIQLGILFTWYYSETRMARESARWLAVHTDTTDDAFADHVQATMMPGLRGSTPTLVSTGSATAGSATEYRVGRMTVRFSPCLPAGPHCTHVDRAAGATLHVQMAYDAVDVIFLPSTFQLPSPGGLLSVSIPTALPAQTVYVMNE